MCDAAVQPKQPVGHTQQVVDGAPARSLSPGILKLVLNWFAPFLLFFFICCLVAFRTLTATESSTLPALA